MENINCRTVRYDFQVGEVQNVFTQICRQNILREMVDACGKPHRKPQQDWQTDALETNRHAGLSCLVSKPRTHFTHLLRSIIIFKLRVWIQRIQHGLRTVAIQCHIKYQAVLKTRVRRTARRATRGQSYFRLLGMRACSNAMLTQWCAGACAHLISCLRKFVDINRLHVHVL